MQKYQNWPSGCLGEALGNGEQGNFTCTASLFRKCGLIEPKRRLVWGVASAAPAAWLVEGQHVHPECAGVSIPPVGGRKRRVVRKDLREL